MFVHGNNIEQKENHKTKYQDDLSKKYLMEIREEYRKWRNFNEELKGPYIQIDKKDREIICERTSALNKYKDFIDQQHYAEQFDSRSNLHSSVLEEFMYYLFRDLAEDFSENALIGKSHTFKDIFFRPNNYAEMLARPSSLIERKDHDFAIGVRDSEKTHSPAFKSDRNNISNPSFGMGECVFSESLSVIRYKYA
jgi:hypothetical protein